MNTCRFALALTFTWALGNTQAFAQIGQYTRPQINPRPTVSPYLNLFRGQSAAANYFGVVRPQIEMGRQLQTLQSEVQTLQTAPLAGVVPVDQQAYTGVPSTGHPTSYMNTSHFFPTPGTRGSGVAGGQGNPTGYANPGVNNITRPGFVGGRLN